MSARESGAPACVLSSVREACCCECEKRSAHLRRREAQTGELACCSIHPPSDRCPRASPCSTSYTIGSYTSERTIAGRGRQHLRGKGGHSKVEPHGPLIPPSARQDRARTVIRRMPGDQLSTAFGMRSVSFSSSSRLTKQEDAPRPRHTCLGSTRP